MPDILVGSFEAAESNADPQQTLTAPHVAGCDCGFPELQSFTAVHQHLHRLLHVGLQQVLQRVVVLVLTQNEQSGFRTFRTRVSLKVKGKMQK